MKRVLFFITSLAGGGAEKVLVNLVNNIDKTKYDVTLLSLFDVGVNKQYISKDVTYKYVFKKSFRGNIHLLKLFSPKFLYRKMIPNEYDIVVSFVQGPTTRIVAGCPYENVKIVQWVHNEFHEKKKIAASYRSISESVKLQKKYDAIVYVANTVKDIYLRTFPELTNCNIKNVVLYNVVESDKITALANEKVEDAELYDNQITLVSVGRMVPQKSFDRLVSVMARLKKEIDIDAKLLLLGSGELLEKLKKQAEELDVNDRVEFLGYRTNPYKYVKNADLFVCSSLHEGFSTAVTESLIVGTPVITTLCSGMEELLGDNEYGVIVENAEEALYTSLVELLTNTEKLNTYTSMAEKRGKYFNAKSTTASVEEFLNTL
ncbi:MAG: glycosyltransferase [Clostridia bacterium]|nr:glycosyltransferase [Clostridia bacterium]